jgi:hypothetical protein
MRPHWDSPALGGASGEAGPGRASVPTNRSRLYAIVSRGLLPSRAFSCCLRRPHAASGCLSLAATLTHPADSKCFLAAAHGANSLKRST